MDLPPVTRKFILHWGEMGARWGINRTIAQIHALLYVTPQPLTAEDIARTLSVARSNVSTSLRELQGWGVVRVVHALGDRCDRFESIQDVWELFQVVIDERKRREVDPTLAVLRECVAEADRAGAADDYSRRRLREMLAFFESATRWYEQMRRLPLGAVVRLMKMGGRVRAILRPAR